MKLLESPGVAWKAPAAIVALPTLQREQHHRMNTSPEQSLPRGACDCHTHVFLDEREFPYWTPRRYTPPPASIEALVAFHDALGVERVVIVQPSVYGPDNSATLKALRVLGLERARGVAVIDDATSDATLRELSDAGVRGVRVNLEVDGERDPDRASAWLRSVVERVGPLGWHIQLFASLPLLGACSPLLGALSVPLVFDHYAGAHARLGAQQQGLPEVLALVECGKAYVKLSAPYRCSDAPGYTDLDALTRLFVERNPQRLLWGSDWPHPQPGVRATPEEVCPPFDVDTQSVLRNFTGWVGDAATLRMILVDNPARLYGFDA
ncbi:Predicted metal-dependent hydrolase, TIM-barrel fold [Variovorax sp. HW608]|uniref:amidohydrolase family protein n=1 Tax=Variovorax sp. HW608 TaxID=1034889 RepID=UPI00081FD350|nr:amidohydrolase family protein [Variovorax sp. HW608]SCK19312.1 Predicted metal-dependent hydrolase, TIM-barrel fold [Variovorax sp. HW608]